LALLKLTILFMCHVCALAMHPPLTVVTLDTFLHRQPVILGSETIFAHESSGSLS